MKRPILFFLILIIIATVLVDGFAPRFFIRNHYHLHPNASYYKVVIKEERRESKKTIRYEAEVIACLKDSAWHSCTGDVLLYFNKKDSLAYNFSYGDLITIPAKLSKIENFPSSEFDYKKYMSRQRVYDNVFVRANTWKLLERNQGNYLIAKAKQLNQILENRLNASLPNQEASIAIAMLLGNKRVLNKDIRQSFNAAGIAHILCVSGLHIGIILMIFNQVLKVFSWGNIKLIYIRKVLLVAIAFGLCLLIGLSPSSLRAATMMSLVFISKDFSRGRDSLSILFLTAFIFLCFDPLILFDLSFQLSFLAVLGILIYNLLRQKFNLRYSRNLILRTISNTAGVSLFAQAFVLPIIILNFKTFPTYFLITNIIILPFIGLILLSIILLLCFADSNLIGGLLSDIVYYQLYLLERVVAFIESLPYSVISF